MSTFPSDPKFKQIDDALAEYYNQLNIPNYYDSNDNGLFLNYIRSEELDDPQLPINNELGDSCNPYDCAYTWMNNDNHFPIPPYAQIPHQDKEAFIFYIMQYCYKHSQPPSHQYIQTVLISKCNGTVNHALLPTIGNNGNVPDSDDDKKDDAPMAFTANLTITNTPKNMNEISSSDNGMEGEVINNSKTKGMEPQITRLSETEFTPKYPARAHLNIFTAKELTKELIHNIEQTFENELILYYYTDISTALQMNDKQMKVFKLLINDKEKQLSIIHYDLHAKGQGEEILYGIIVPNANYKVNQDKWLWKVDEFLIGSEIYNKYKIQPSELPKSSRKMPLFCQQLSQQLVIEETLIDETDWFNIQQIKSLKRNIKIPKVIITLTKEMWITECKKSFSNVNLPLIPVVVNKNNSHWIEWIKIVYISSQNMYVGISLKYDENNNKWSVQSMCLDRGDIYNKHRLVGLTLDEYDCQLVEFKTSITEIKFSDNDSKDVDKKMNVLKQQIRSQQDSIVRLKESLLRAKNANKYGNKGCDEQKQRTWDNKKYICEFMSDELEKENECNSDEWLNAIVDDVIKMYDVLEFKTSPIGAKRNIYIDKQFTRLWMEYVLPKFNDESMMYYWLDYTTAMQMCQGYSKQYVNKVNRKFMVAIVNYELTDKNGNILYGIIVCNDEGECNDNKYRYRLNVLMTKEQIKREYGINKYDLPKKSRKCKEFMDKLLLKRRIVESDLNRINWNNLKLFKSQSTHNDPINKSVTITQKVMKEYCAIALERLDLENGNGKNNLIPIVVIDKHSNYYGIEWILIVNIIHRNCDVGISFRYDEKLDLFIATAIYLDKGEIESKHKLIGLTFDYCKHLRPFSLRKFKFKSDKHSIIDDDETVINTKQIQLKQQLLKYKNAFEREQSKVYQLQSQIQNAQNMYANLKYQSDQLINNYQTQQMMNYQSYTNQYANQYTNQ